MAATENDLAVSRDNRSSGSLTWAVSLVTSAYFALVGISLFRVTPVFLDMYASLNAELPLQTQLLVPFRWLYPLLFGGAITVVIAKQFYVREKSLNMAVSFASFAVIDALVIGIIWALYAPILSVTEKLSK